MRIRLKVKNYDLVLLGERGREISRGELAHQALYFLDPLPKGAKGKEIRSLVALAVARALALADPRLEENYRQLERELISLLTKALSLPEVRPYFEEGVRAWPEVEIMDETGALHRIDRLVFTEEGPVILEFKLGGRRRAHWEQVRLYRRLVKAAYGLEPRAFLFYLEEPALVEVGQPTQLPLF